MKLSPEDKAMLITFSGASILAVIFLFFTIKPYDTSQVEEFIPIPIIEEEVIEEELLEQTEEEVLQTQQITNQAQSSSRLVREANRFFSQFLLIHRPPVPHSLVMLASTVGVHPLSDDICVLARRRQ